MGQQPRVVQGRGAHRDWGQKAGRCLHRHRAPDLMKVKVTAPVQVVWADTRCTKGDTADVPDDVAESWLRQGWVSEVKHATPRKKTS